MVSALWTAGIATIAPQPPHFTRLPITLPDEAGPIVATPANKLWAADGGSNGPWTSNSNQKISWTQNNSNRSYVFFSGNYVNWLRNASTITQTRLEIIQQVATNTINQLAAQGAVNVGLMRFSNNTGGDNVSGGLFPVGPTIVTVAVW